MIFFNEHNLVSEFFSLLFGLHNFELKIWTLLLNSIGKLPDLHLPSSEDILQFSDLLFVNVQSISVLSFDILNFSLTLCPYIINLHVLNTLKFTKLSIEVFNFPKHFLFFVLYLWHKPYLLIGMLIKLIFENLIFWLVLMKKAWYFLILAQKLVVLSENKFNFFFQLIEFFAFGFKENIFFLQHGDISFEHFFDSCCMLIEFIVNHLTTGTWTHGTTLSHWDDIQNYKGK